MTGMLLLSSSHMTLHTWPEHAYAALDIFTCGADDTPQDGGETEAVEGAEPEKAAARLVEALGAKESRSYSFARGMG